MSTTTVELPPRDADGYLENMNDWTPEIGQHRAAAARVHEIHRQEQEGAL